MSERGVPTPGPRVVVALDFPQADEALGFVTRVTPALCRLKVGMELYTAAGPRIVEELVGRGFDVFLDLKFHDIPTTVGKACSVAARLGVWMLNVHALGGRHMLEAARAAVDAAPRRPLLIGVTVLTSHSPADLADLGMAPDTDTQVARLARLVHTAGLDGVVCSAHEVAALRAQHGAGFVLVTPGIRPEGSSVDDQHRVLTPRTARMQGSDYLVMGRPIVRAADPLSLLQQINNELHTI
jgi:orotidine-5'-phosphate decarboxylase